jgi:hypothetical protein
MSKNMITGGLSEREARSMLLERGILAFKTLAGSLPQETHENYDLPRFRAKNIDVVKIIHRKMNYKRMRYDVIEFGTRHVMSIECQESLCYDCSKAISRYLCGNVHVCYNWSNEVCCMCAGMCDDTIPF